MGAINRTTYNADSQHFDSNEKPIRYTDDEEGGATSSKKRR